MPPWVTLITGPFLPILKGIGEFFAAQLLKYSYIKQGKQEQQLKEIKYAEESSDEAKNLKNGIGLSTNSELELLLGKKPK